MINVAICFFDSTFCFLVIICSSMFWLFSDSLLCYDIIVIESSFDCQFSVMIFVLPEVPIKTLRFSTLFVSPDFSDFPQFSVTQHIFRTPLSFFITLLFIQYSLVQIISCSRTYNYNNKESLVSYLSCYYKWCRVIQLSIKPILILILVPPGIE